MTLTAAQRPDGSLGANRRFESYHPWDRNFFLGYVGLIWFVILLGFAPEVIQRIQSHSPFPLIVHIHAVIFVGWRRMA